MGQKTFKTRVQIKRDTAANWELNNPILLNGEEILVDTSAGETRKKVGDGVKSYTQLPFTDEIIRGLINGKVDKVSGKGLSTNDFTTALKNKLDGIAEGANKYTHPSTHAATMITPDASHRFVTDSQISTWNAKASTAVATTTTNGLMSSDDKTKLDGIAENANNYSHPSTHSASMITQDASHRFVSDTEKNTWSAKASTAVATQTANGLMSSGDKTKLDGIATGANKTVVDSALSSTSTNPLQNKVINSALSGKSNTGHKHTKSEITDFPTSMPASDVSAWAKAATKPTYTAAEVGADASGAASGALSSAKSYTDGKISDLINGAPTTLDTLKEIADAIATNDSVVDALEDAVGNKANAFDLTAHTGNTTVHITSTERTNWNAAKAHADKAHAPSNAQANQNAYSNVKIGTTTIAADNTTDTLELVGSNVTLTPDATNDKVTIGITKSNVTDALGYTPPTTDTKYTHPGATAYASGLYKITTNSLGHVTAASAVTKADITALGIPAQDTNTTYSDMKGATSSAAGTHGLAPAPAAGAANRYLRSDGTWAVPPDTNTTYGDATTSARGLMTAAMVTKLNGIADGANNYSHPGSHPASMVVEDATHRFVSDTDKSNLSSLLTRVSTLESNYNSMLAKLKTAVFVTSK